jgi:hypothetical protein
MHRALLGPALTFALTAPLAVAASAQSVAVAGFSASSGVREIHFVTPRTAYGVRIHRRFDDRNGRHFLIDRRMGYGGYGYAAGYEDPGDYDANRSFDPDKWNDWWHERPERAFPRWMARNRDCARQWYSGDVLTC